MKVKVELLYADNGKEYQTLKIKDGLKGNRLFAAIDKAIRRGNFGDWIRWNLLDIIVKGEPGYE